MAKVLTKNMSKKSNAKDRKDFYILIGMSKIKGIDTSGYKIINSGKRKICGSLDVVRKKDGTPLNCIIINQETEKVKHETPNKQTNN